MKEITIAASFLALVTLTSIFYGSMLAELITSAPNL